LANYRGPKCKLCRREGQKLFLKGDKCYGKCTLDKRPEPPGKAGQPGGLRASGRGGGRAGGARGAAGGGRSPAGGGRSGGRRSGGRTRMSDYGIRLREKQKLRRTYGVLERQFRTYFQRAEGMPGVTGGNLLGLLECRLDNVIFRLGIAASRPHARQLVTHRHVRVNGRPANVPSILLSPGDRIELKSKSRTSPFVLEIIQSGSRRDLPGWIERAPDGFSGRVLGTPTRDQIDTDVQEQLIVEYYSR